MTLRLRLPVEWVPNSIGGIVSSAASDASSLVGTQVAGWRSSMIAAVRPAKPPRSRGVTIARRVVGGAFALSALAMAVAAATADSDKGIRSDGSKEPVEGDPKAGGASPEANESKQTEPANPD